MLALLLTTLLLEPLESLEPSEPSEEPTAPVEVPAEPSAPSGEPSTMPEPPPLPDPPSGGITPATPVSLRWSAPLGCPSVDELREGIERRLGRTLEGGDVEVDAQIVAQEGGYRLILQTEAGGIVDRRTLDADDCGALTDATALIVALAVDPVAVAGAMELWGAAASDAADTPAEPVESTPAPRRTAPAEPSSSSSTSDSKRSGLDGGLLRLSGGAGLGAVPGVTGALSLAGGLRWQRARLELEGAYWIPRRSEPIDGATVQIQLGTAAVRGCGVLARDRLEAPLCGGVQVGGMRGVGEGLQNAQTAQGLWVAFEAGVGLSWWFRPRWGLAGGFSAAVPVVQPGFDLDREPPVRLFEPPPVAGRLWLGLELRL